MPSRKEKYQSLLVEFLAGPIDVSKINELQSMSPHEKFEAIMIVLHCTLSSINGLVDSSNQSIKTAKLQNKAIKRLDKKTKIAGMKATALCNYLNMEEFSIDFVKVNAILSLLIKQIDAPIEQEEKPKEEKKDEKPQEVANDSDESIVNKFIASLDKKKLGFKRKSDV